MFSKDGSRNFIQNVSRRVTEIRTIRGFTQNQIAEKMDISLREYQKMEDRSISLWTLYRLTEVLNCPAGDFFKVSKTKKLGRGRPKKKT